MNRAKEEAETPESTDRRVANARDLSTPITDISRNLFELRMRVSELVHRRRSGAFRREFAQKNLRRTDTAPLTLISIRNPKLKFDVFFALMHFFLYNGRVECYKRKTESIVFVGERRL